MRHGVESYREQTPLQPRRVAVFCLDMAAFKARCLRRACAGSWALSLYLCSLGLLIPQNVLLEEKRTELDVKARKKGRKPAIPTSVFPKSIPGGGSAEVTQGIGKARSPITSPQGKAALDPGHSCL